MHSYLVPAGIRFKDYLFSEPVQLAGWRAPHCAGVIAILAHNPQWGPKPYQPLFFGACSQLPSHVRRNDLWVALLPMPYSTAQQQRDVCQELAAAYGPVTVADLTHRIDVLEARQQEQSQQILSLLTFIGKLFEPQPVGPRKPIGFLPQLSEVTESGN